MLDSMRKPFLIVALIAIALAVLVELGSIAMVRTSQTSAGSSTAAALQVSPAGKAIPAMAFLDGLILFATVIITIALLVPERVQSKVQGIVTLIFSILLVLGCIVVIFADIALLFLMVGLLMAVPFGTLAYMAVWASFDTPSASAALSAIMLLKIVFAVCLVLAQQRFLENKGLVLIMITSFISNLVIAFLQGMVPGFLVSITDDIAAIIVCILAIIWAVVYLIGGIISVVKVIV
jgi:hypothetical protein